MVQVFKEIARVEQIKKIMAPGEAQHVIEYGKNGTLELYDHICLVVTDVRGMPTDKSDFHGLVSDFTLVEGSLGR
jgi:hypothetical protein